MPAPPHRARNRHTTSEPKLERVVVSPNETGQGADDAVTEPKRGWWQRRMGG
jgi:hypothetical protein